MNCQTLSFRKLKKKKKKKKKKKFRMISVAVVIGPFRFKKNKMAMMALNRSPVSHCLRFRGGLLCN